MKINWKAVEKSQTSLARKIKYTKNMKDYFENPMEKGFVRDSAYLKTKQISELPESSIRRIIKMLEKYYYMIDDSLKKKEILSKITELQTELNQKK